MADNFSDEFTPTSWDKMGFSERVRAGTRAYLQGGLGFKVSDYAFHGVKLVLFVVGWMLCCRATPGLGGVSNFTTWVFEPIAFQKAFLWGCLVEVTGFGCMSGPLGMRIKPRFTAWRHFLRPGTIKLAPFPRLPLFGGITRSLLDVTLYAGLLLALLWALIQPELRTSHFLAVVILFTLSGLGDKTVWLAGRVEHHGAMIVCFLLAGNWIAAAKWVQLSIWFWAGVSKLTPAFPYVVPIMTTNNSLVTSPAIRRHMFVDPPEDMRPSRLARTMAFAGGFLEFAAPLTLLFVIERGPLLYLGIFWVLVLHGFILSNLPIAAVFEWNILSIYAALFLFVGSPEVSLFAIGSLPLTAYLLIALLLLPLVGNLFPDRVSFLVAMRYYAGNWAWNAWLFRDDSYLKLDCLPRAAPLAFQQQQELLPPDQSIRAEATLLAFRALHLQGRALGLLTPQATDGHPFEEYTYVDGEAVAASVLGWNFGEGHLADERLLAALQSQCHFSAGDLRILCVEAQPLLGSTLHWRIIDASEGQLAEGQVSLHDLANRNPWDYGAMPTG